MRLLTIIIVGLYERVFLLLGLASMVIVAVISPTKALRVIQDWSDREHEIEKCENIASYVESLRDLVRKKEEDAA